MSNEKPVGSLWQLIAVPWRGPVFTFAGLFLALIWSYWSTLQVMAEKWAHDPQYSHGWLVPFFAAGVLWMRRATLPPTVPSFSVWGLALLSAGVAVRLIATFFYFEWFDFLSIIPTVAGLTLLCFGWRILWWSLPAILFLGFMLPLPFRIETAMRDPLRSLGAVASTYVMQTLGLAAFREGYTIVTDSGKIGVADACSGLRMLMIFFALATAVAMLSKRELWEKLIIVVSAVPIALIANIARITVTGILHETVGGEIADLVFHDLAGWLMMPFGLALLGAELWFLSRVLIVEHEVPLGPLEMLGLNSGLQAARAVAGRPANRSPGAQNS